MGFVRLQGYGLFTGMSFGGASAGLSGLCECTSGFWDNTSKVHVKCGTSTGMRCELAVSVVCVTGYSVGASSVVSGNSTTQVDNR